MSYMTSMTSYFPYNIIKFIHENLFLKRIECEHLLT